MKQEKTVSIKDLNLSKFEKLLLTLVKFYPKAKKQKELAKEAGIYESEISRWRRKEKKRGESYVEFFKKYIDIDLKTLGFKLKVHEDIINRLIEMAKKDKRAKEIISKSIYFKELASKDLRLLIIALSNRILDLERAKNLFIRMLESNGITKNEVIEKLNISEKALSCYTKLYLNFLLNRFRIFGSHLFDNLLDKIIKDVKEGKPTFERSFLNVGWVLAINLMEAFDKSGGIVDEYMFPFPPFIDKPHIDYCSDEELDELFTWLAKKEKYSLGTLSADLFDNYLLKKAGKPLKVRKWVKVGCVYLHLEFDLRDLNLKEMIASNSARVNVDIANWIDMVQCPVDKNKCKLDISERFNCPKFEELLKKEVIE